MAVHCALSTLMGKHRYSIQDMHIKTGLSRNTISNLYNDRATRVDYDTIDKLCTALNCSISDLFLQMEAESTPSEVSDHA